MTLSDRKYVSSLSNLTKSRCIPLWCCSLYFVPTKHTQKLSAYTNEQRKYKCNIYNCLRHAA